MKNENFCRIMILILLISLMSPLLQFIGIDIINTAKADILTDYEIGWNSSIQFRIDHSYIDEDLENFPILVRLNATVANRADSGNSVRFTSQDASQTYYHQIDYWNNSGGNESTVWVNIPILSSSDDTHFVMWYNNTTAVDTQTNLTWDENYLAVYHLNETAGVRVEDSSRYGNNASYVGDLPTQVDGYAGKAQYFDGAGDWILMESTCHTPDNGTLEISLQHLVDVGFTPVWYDRLTVPEELSFVIQADGDYNFYDEGDWNIRPDTNDAFGNNFFEYISIGWGPGQQKLSRDGAVMITGSDAYCIPERYVYEIITIGATHIIHLFLQGVVDEVRVSNIVRSDNWLEASFHTLNNTTGFLINNGGINSGVTQTNSPIETNHNNATLSGTLYTNGNKPTTCGFRWGIYPGIYTSNVTAAASPVSNGTTFTYNAHLNESVVYFYQAWSDNNGGFSTGRERSFRAPTNFANYSYCSPFVINRDFIDDNLHNFPMLVSINSTIGALADEGGRSLRFASPEGEEYYYEIDYWDATATSYVWVNISEIFPYWNTTVYMYYNNSAAINISINDYMTESVWDRNFLFVSHMNSTTTTIYDATSNGNDGTKDAAADPVEVAGRIGRAQDFDLANTEKILLDNDISGLTAITIESWVDRQGPCVAPYAIVSSAEDASVVTDINYGYLTDPALVWNVSDGAGAISTVSDGTTYLNTWTYTAAYWGIDIDAGGVYNNETVQGVDPTSSGIMNNNVGSQTTIGAVYANPAYDSYMDGVIDEIRISNIIRSQAWINASYFSQNQTSGFFTWLAMNSPHVGTNETTSITTSSATLSGTLHTNGGQVSTSYGFRWGTDADNLVNNQTVNAGGATANDTSFTYSLTTLSEGTLYYVQSWARNGNDFVTGTIQSFWTNATWWNSDFEFRRTITIDKDFIDNDLTDFPILVIIPNAPLGDKCDNGNSIRFLKNSSVEYFFDIDEWNNTNTSESYVWVNVTHVYDDADTVFYMYYNNSTATNNESGRTWNDGYLGVYHLNETSGTTFFDSTLYGNDATYNFNVNSTTAQVGRGLYINRVDAEFISFPAGCLMSGDDFGTQEFWIRSDESHVNMIMLGQYDAADTNYAYTNFTNNRYQFYGVTGGAAQWTYNNIPMDLSYNHYVAQAMAKNNVAMRVDNTNISTDTTCNMPTAAFNTIRFSGDRTGNDLYSGIVDEIRISNTTRNNSWLSASAMSAWDAPGFFTWGSEVRAVLVVQTNDPIVVYTQNATLSGTLVAADESTTVRFLLNNSSVSYTGGRNTSNQTVTIGTTFYNNTSLPRLNPGDRYYYQAYANDTDEEAWGSNTSFLTQPNASSGLTLTPGNLQITLTWTNNDGGDGCYIEFSENFDPGPGWVFGNNTSLGYQTTPYTHTPLNVSSTYYYKAWAYANDDGWQSEVGNTSAPLNQTGITGNESALGINVTTNASTGVEEMNATMWGWLNNSAGGFATCRFQYNNTTAFDINTTNQTVTAGANFSENVTGLTPGMFYHYRAYANNTVNNTTGAPMVFLTKPNASTNLLISLVGGGDNGFNITWTNNTGCNQTIVVRNNTSFPTDQYDGWEIYNGTNESFIDDPLTDLQTYYYRIWAYANWTWQGVNYHQFSDGNVSATRTYISAPVVVLDPTNVLLTTATLRLYFDGGGTTYKVGFWVSCLTPTAGNPGLNLSDGVDYTVPQLVTYPATGLQQGQYYYIQAWARSSVEFLNTTNTTYMIMVPNPPTNLQATASGGNSIQLNWVRFSPPACAGGTTSNRTTVVRYTTSLPYPSGSTGENGTATGTWIYNGTANNYLHTGLDADLTYYYSMWTYVDDSGSPVLNAWSTYSTVSAGTEGGNYTIYLRYENVSYDRIPLTRGRNHQFVVHYTDRTEYNFWDDSGMLITTGTYRNQSNFTTMGETTGNFSFNATSRPLWMEFHWNDTTYMEYRCNRIVIPQTGQRNVTFYLTINLPVFRETIFVINNTLVKYAYSFVDETGFFDTQSNALAEIFFYSSNPVGDNPDNKIIVHSEYWDTELRMYPWLVYGKKYFMGVYCDDFNVTNLGIAPSEQNEEPQIVIPFSYTETDNFFDYINLTLWWQDATTLGLTYIDTDYSSTNVTLRLYWWNNTLITTNYYENLSIINHFWTGLNNTYSYKIEVRTVNDIWPDGLSSGKIPFYGVISLSVTNTTLDSVMTTIFGQSPLWVENIHGTERTVPWSQVIIFGVAFILLVTLGKLNAFLGMAITGGWLVFSSFAITGVQLVGGAALGTIGLFLIAISVIGLLGGVERR